MYYKIKSNNVIIYYTQTILLEKINFFVDKNILHIVNNLLEFNSQLIKFVILIYNLKTIKKKLYFDLSFFGGLPRFLCCSFFGCASCTV